MSRNKGKVGHSGKASDNLSEQAHTRLTVEELNALDAIAEAEGRSRSDVLRRAAFRGPVVNVRRMA